jgi:hypothetical protein
MSAIEVRNYLERARDFLEGMKRLEEEEFFIRGDEMVPFRHSPAWLGVHCAISYCDALRIGLGNQKLSAEDHAIAPGMLRSCLAARNYARLEGVNHLASLIAKRNRIAYTSENLRVVEALDLVKKAARFALWAEETGLKLKIEGW